jgi:hypothetical protein
MMQIRRPVPNERGRRWFTLLGSVVSHRWVDKRDFITKFLAKKFPSIKMFQDGLHLMAEVEIDDGSYTEAGQKLKVPTIDGWGGNILRHSAFEILPSELPRYQIGQLVGVSFGMSNAVDQFFTGTTPVRYELHHVGSEEEFAKLPDPVLPVQRTLFLQV